jgi:Ser/Thr protein kinase RdoA (MazF antagonist)
MGMADYTPINLEEASDLLALYSYWQNRPKIKSLTPMGSGISNTNYRVNFVESPDEIMLKISNDKNQHEMLEEHNILFWLQEQNFTLAPLPFLTLTQESLFSFKQFHGCVFPVYPGAIPINRNKFELSQMAWALASLHCLPYPRRPLTPLELMPSSGQSSPTLRPHSKVGHSAFEILTFATSPHCPVDFKEFILTPSVQDILKKWCELAPQIPQGLIHGDLYYDNILFSSLRPEKEKPSLKLLDWEQSGVGLFLLDVGIALSGSCFHSSDTLDWQKNEAIYWQSYQQARPLTLIEESLKPSAAFLGLLSICLWRIYRFNIKQIAPNKKFSYQELLNKAKRYHHLYAPI